MISEAMRILNARDRLISLDHTIIIGTLNVTPDSFYDGGKFVIPEIALAHAHTMAEDGADIIDIGGESTRPGSESISAETELSRLVPVLSLLLEKLTIPISIDTTKAEVARECLRMGAHIINDVSGLQDPQMRKVIAEYNVPAVIMHMKGIPKIMRYSTQTQEALYTDVIGEIKTFLFKRAKEAKKDGISQIIIDPGIGYGKRLEDNLAIIKNLAEFKALGYPILVGVSRKSFIGKLLNLEPEDRLEGTLAANTACILYGADMLRVHDVKEAKRAAAVAKAIAQSE